MIETCISPRDPGLEAKSSGLEVDSFGVDSTGFCGRRGTKGYWEM